MVRTWKSTLDYASCMSKPEVLTKPFRIHQAHNLSQVGTNERRQRRGSRCPHEITAFLVSIGQCPCFCPWRMRSTSTIKLKPPSSPSQISPVPSFPALKTALEASDLSRLPSLFPASHYLHVMA